ncbi:sensor histidine kinase [uncultured Traorella sp.]|uniref:sensor histidine kinase n=1 Tax=uncultured Traorella sp. TaxID=1929048 RepID=UPI0025F24210|nr:sensor histidine kinase [uncultured Traorella sp.]
MRKKKNIFMIVFTLLLLVMSSSFVFLSGKAHTSVKENIQVHPVLEREMKLFVLSIVQEVDDSYQLLSFDESVSDEDKKQIGEMMDQIINDIRYKFDDDADFVYQVTQTMTKTQLSNHYERIHENDDINDYYFYDLLRFDGDGKIINEGDLHIEEASDFNLFDLIIPYYDDYQNTAYFMGNEFPSLEGVSINMPKNIEITMIVPSSLTSFGYVTYMLDNWENNNGFAVISLLLFSAVLILFFLIYPISIVEQAPVFRSIIKQKGEIMFSILCILISIGCTACLFISYYSLNDSFGRLLNIYQIAYPQYIVPFVNGLIWFITLFMISLGLYYIKYMFAHGFGRYVREDTFIGAFCKWIKRKMNQLAEVDLSQPVNRPLMQFMLIQLVIILLLVWGPFGYVFAILYVLGLFFWLLNKVKKIQKDYQKLLKAAEELSKGNFDQEMSGDVGVFNALNEEFAHIKSGFEKAVEDEIKSSNMKTELISNVSHDLKTPLTCIKNYIVLLQDESISDETRQEYLKNLAYYSSRLTTLIEDLFEVSKVNSGNVQLDCVDLNIVALIEQICAESEEMLQSKNLKVISHYDKNEIMLYLDGGKTCRIFENLFTNIGKYAMPESRVYIDVRDENDAVRIELKNMSEAEMNFTPEEIVERFVRGDKSRHESGSGLGLAIAQSFTEIQNGEFKIEIDGDLFKVIIRFFRKENIDE